MQRGRHWHALVCIPGTSALIKHNAARCMSFSSKPPLLNCSAAPQQKGQDNSRGVFVLSSKVNRVWFWHLALPCQSNMHVLFNFKLFNSTEYTIIFTVSNSSATGNLFITSYASARKSLIPQGSFENLQFLCWTKSKFLVYFILLQHKFIVH